MAGEYPDDRTSGGSSLSLPGGLQRWAESHSIGKLLEPCRMKSTKDAPILDSEGSKRAIFGPNSSGGSGRISAMEPAALLFVQMPVLGWSPGSPLIFGGKAEQNNATRPPLLFAEDAYPPPHTHLASWTSEKRDATPAGTFLPEISEDE